MKKFLLPVLLLVMGLMVFAACGAQDVDPNNPLIGRWTWDEHTTYVYTFNADGTGTRGGALFGGLEGFTWWTTNNDSRLELRMDTRVSGQATNQPWDITWNGNDQITLTSRLRGSSEVFTYSRVD